MKYLNFGHKIHFILGGQWISMGIQWNSIPCKSRDTWEFNPLQKQGHVGIQSLAKAGTRGNSN